ncbi:MAG: LysR family transcriptional regulator [Proteobacteria bacterium]|nr:LysR family transcriptional regulator [Pseudomonadota bacterium]
METQRLEHINLNLLLALDALLSEVGVSRAAQRLGVSQPAMSQSLRQLRELFDDPLLVRSGGEMALTPKAETLALPLRRALVELQRLLQGDIGFDPTQSQRRFTVAMADSVVGLLPRLLEKMGEEAPSVDLEVRPLVTNHYPERLATGELDVAISTNFDSLTRDVRSEVLFSEPFVCLARKSNPGIVLDESGRLELEAYLALPHALISPRGEGPAVVDTALEALGRKRRIALRVPYFLAAPLVVAHSDLILTAPVRTAREFTHVLDLFDPPIELPPFDVLLVWHQRFDKDPSNRWFRRLLVAAAKE